MKLKGNNILKILLQEKNLFLVVTAFTLIPILAFRFFPTMDGAAHLYNSNLLNEILFNSNNSLSDFFLVNNKPVPNLTGHIILSFFNLFLPAFLAEKIFLILYVVGLSYFFRKLVLSINKENSYLSYFIFPFVYSFVFILGFYNFSIALVFFFITLSYWINNRDKSLGVKQIIFLFLLFSATFFSHIFVFAVLLLSIGILFIVKNISELYHSNNDASLKKIFKKLGALLISVFIPFVLFIHYFYSRPPANKIGYLSKQELKDNLYNFRSILSYNSIEENQYIDKIVYVFLLFIGAVLLIRLRQLIVNFQIHNKLKGLFQQKDLWLIIGAILLTMYFLLPDSTSYGGFITNRVSLIFYLIIIIWISSHKIPKMISILLISVVLYSHVSLVRYYTTLIKNLNEVAVNCNEASGVIEPNSVVLPLNYSQEWLALHFSNYLGIEKPMVILDNYEAVNDYFPLMWNWPHLTSPIYDNIAENNFLCMDSTTYLNQENYDIDYIFVLDDINNKTDECRTQKKNELTKLTTLIFENKNCKVYKLKNSQL